MICDVTNAYFTIYVMIHVQLHRAKMSHIQLSQEERDRLGITDNFLRLSVGLEGAQALIEDIDQALKIAVA